MIRFYHGAGPNPAKVALLLAETALPFETVVVDTYRGAQHDPAFRAINPNGKVPAIVDTDGPAGVPVAVFDSTAILLYLAGKAGCLLGTPAERPAMLSWLMFVATGLGPFSGQATHFQYAAPETPYALRRYRGEIERHYQVLEDHLATHEFLAGGSYTIADISAWGWLDRAARVMKDMPDPWQRWPNLGRLMATIDARPAAVAARAILTEHTPSTGMDDAARRALFPFLHR